ncbi:uncharacterized protein tbc1d10c [Genypterus blacodes]|uniref:uncharacterized protein tbc1d10c n=1 Tax=Genypterus blacodes TaxID=154954 RepID=UPI003F76B926
MSSIVVQRNFREDSSGSDAGSEVSVEPETDRFGFILTNRCTPGVVGPSAELVRQREAKWIRIVSQWDSILLKKSSKVKVQCQKGIPTSLRAKCWPLLCGATDKMKHNKDLYKLLDSKPAQQCWVDVIERDLDRQFPFHEMFLSKEGHGQRGLFRVLKAYTQFQPEEGYCQAQGPVAAVLLMNMPAEEAFWCLVQISEQYLPGYYSPLLEGVLFDAAMLTWVLKRSCPAAHRHLQHFGVEPLMFATDWLMCLFTRHLPFNTLLRVWDLFFCYGVKVLFQVAVVLVRQVLGQAKQRKQCQGQMETLERLRGVREQVQQDDETFITEVCSVPLSAKDLEKQTEKELEKWRKDRPSSTFDPRDRCHGYRTVWARAQENEEPRDMRERQKGNLSVPLFRSASTLSLSPALLHKKWRKGGKVSAEEWEGTGKEVRKHSLGAREKDWKSWTDLNLKTVLHDEEVEEEDFVSEKYRKQSELKLKGQSEEVKPPAEPKVQAENPSEAAQHEDEVTQQNELAESKNAEKNDSQQGQTDRSQCMDNVPQQETGISEEDIAIEREPDQSPTEPQAVGDTVQGAKVDSNDESQVVEDQSHEEKDQETEIRDTEETPPQEADSEQVVAVEVETEIVKDTDTDINTDTDIILHTPEESMTQVAIQTEEITETENVQLMKTETVAEIRIEGEVQSSETSPGSKTDGDVQAVLNTNPGLETTPERREEGMITQTKRSPDEDAFKQQDASSTETDIEAENVEGMMTVAEIRIEDEDQSSETSPGSQTDEDVQAPAVLSTNPGLETTQLQGEQDMITQTDKSPDEGEEDMTSAGTETEVEATTLNQTETEILERTQEKEIDCVDMEEKSEIDVSTDEEQDGSDITETKAACLTECTKLDQPDSQRSAANTPESDETQCGTLTLTPPPAEDEIVSNSVIDHIHHICDLTQAEETTPTHLETAESKTSPQNLTAEPDGKSTDTPVESEPERPKSPVEEEERMEHKKENTAGGENVFMLTSKIPLLESQLQVAGHRTSSGEFCVRRSSTSRDSRFARRLSEDLFIAPLQTTRPQSTPTHPHLHVQPDPKAMNSGQTPLDVIQHSPQNKQEVSGSTKETVAEPEKKSKRFGLFRRLKGEQPKERKQMPKLQVPKILIQDFSDGVVTVKPVEEEEEKLSSRERRRRRREEERRVKEEERLRKKREKEPEKKKERERRKPQTRGKSFQVQTQPQRSPAPYAESYF